MAERKSTSKETFVIGPNREAKLDAEGDALRADSDAQLPGLEELKRRYLKGDAAADAAEKSYAPDDKVDEITRTTQSNEDGSTIEKLEGGNFNQG